jgi:hypothetical protein
LRLAVDPVQVLEDQEEGLLSRFPGIRIAIIWMDDDWSNAC